ncbi:transcriptional regulator with XRE-family HTH domain [Providencia alcalifaciens]|nr:transcriptional regulator with XRE-family HTH domain [Providencia alcalifaciens]
MENINQIVGKEIRKRRKNLGLSGMELADLIGISQQQISRYERGECNITLENLFSLAIALEVSLIYFLSDELFSIETKFELRKDNKEIKNVMVNHYI